MKTTVMAALLLLAASGAAPAFAQAQGPTPSPDDARIITTCLAKAGNLQGACVGLVADACLKTADSTQRMGDCEARERAIWDGWLNRDYAAVKAALKPAARVQLIAIERAFVADMARRCDFVAVVDGPTTMNRPSSEECALRATAQQWLWLRSFLPGR